MIDFTAMLPGLQGYSSLPSMQGGKSQGSSGKFATAFEKASTDAGAGKTEATGKAQKKQEPPEISGGKTDKTGADQGDFSEEDNSEEMAVLASSTILQTQVQHQDEAAPEGEAIDTVEGLGTIIDLQSQPDMGDEQVTVPETAEAAAQEGFKLPEQLTDQSTEIPEEIVSILESNMEIEAQKPDSTQQTQQAPPQETEQLPQTQQTAPVDTAPVAKETEQTIEPTARMPVETVAAEVKAETKEAPVASTDDMVVSELDAKEPCPLENKNDNRQSSTSDNTSTGDDDLPETQTSTLGQQVDISPERLSAKEVMGNQPQAVTATPQTLYNTLVESVQTMNTAESQFMEIQLRPDYLGKVSVELSLTADGLEVKLKAEDEGVRNLLAGQIAQLSETLADKGTKVTQIDVIYTGVSEQGFKEQDANAGGQGGQPQQNGRARRADKLSMSLGFGFEAVDESAATMVDAGISSVEYRA